MLSKLKKNLKQMMLKIGKKLRTACHYSKLTGSYKKESEYMHIDLLSIIDNSDNNLHILSLFRQRTKQLL